jgi:hypothetical protein
MGKVKFFVSVLPPDMLLGIATGPGEAFCSECDDIHEFYTVQVGLLFVVFNFLYFY